MHWNYFLHDYHDASGYRPLLLADQYISLCTPPHISQLYPKLFILDEVAALAEHVSSKLTSWWALSDEEMSLPFMVYVVYMVFFLFVFLRAALDQREIPVTQAYLGRK